MMPSCGDINQLHQMNQQIYDKPVHSTTDGQFFSNTTQTSSLNHQFFSIQKDPASADKCSQEIPKKERSKEEGQEERYSTTAILSSSEGYPSYSPYSNTSKMIFTHSGTEGLYEKGDLQMKRASVILPWGHMCAVVSTMPLITLFFCLATCLFFDTAHINDTVCQVRSPCSLASRTSLSVNKTNTNKLTTNN